MKSSSETSPPTLEQRIDRQEQWTFTECLGLASEFNMKVRAVVVTVMVRGKRYVDGKQKPPGVGT